MTNPTERFALACNYIRGPKVHDWVADQVDALQVKVFGDANNAPTHADTDEALWQNFRQSFGAYSPILEQKKRRLPS